MRGFNESKWIANVRFGISLYHISYSNDHDSIQFNTKLCL